MINYLTYLFQLLDSTFSFEIKDLFRNYIASHQQTKWMVFSDFCIGDKNKPNDVFSFVFVPYIISIDNFSRLAKEKLPEDFKKIRGLNEQAGLFLNNHNFFSITVILEKNRKLYYSDGQLLRQDRYLKSFNETIAILKGRPIEKKLKSVVQDLKSKSPNLSLLDDVLIVAFLGAYFCKTLAESLNKVEKIGWFPDRDKITEVYNNLAYDLMCQNFYSITTNMEEQILTFGKMEQEGPGWYDNLNRVPDYLAGAISSFNLQKNLVTHIKHSSMLTDVFADSNQHVVLKMKFSQSGHNFSRIKISKKK